jgi:hypothetical protein
MEDSDMDKVKLVLGINVTSGTTQIDVLEAAADDPSYNRITMIEPYAKKGGYGYYTVIDAWAADEEGEAEPKGE